MRRGIKIMVAAIAVLALAAAACTSDGSSEATSPGTTAVESVELDIVETAGSAGDFTTLVTAVEAAGLTETLKGEGPYTVFAPTDAAFAALPEGTLESLLLEENQDQLSGILTYHVVSDSIMASEVASGTVATVNGAEFTVATEDGVVITDGQGNEAQVVQTDIVASNGVIHVIDGVLIPA